MIRGFVFALFFSCCCSSAIGQPLGFSLADGKQKVTIPIEIYSNLVVVPVFLNGALPLKFILDTGVRTAILTQKTFTDILNVPYSRKYSISGPGGVKVIDAYVANNMSLEMPGVTGRGHALLVLEEDYLELRNYLGTDVHGVLGYELFSRFIVEINYDKKTLTLSTPDRFRKKRKFQTIPIRVEDTKPYITTQIVLNDSTQITGKLLVDSGASHGLLLEPSTDARITLPTNYVSSSIGRGLGGDIVGKVGRIESIALGTHVLPNIVARFPDPNSYFDSLKVGNVPRNGAIGGELLSRFTVIFNFPREEMYLRRASSFRKAFHFNLSGLTVKAKGSNLGTYEVTDVRKQSTADDAGILVGDLITSINGITSKDLSLSLINAFFNFKPGKQIRLEVKRGNQPLRFKFRLQDEI